jgi:hypothetical protein
LHQFSIIGDEVTGGTIDMRYSDDDFRSWSSYISMDISATPSRLFRLGQFRRRAFHLRSTSNTPIRLEAIEVVVSMGTS